MYQKKAVSLRAKMCASMKLIVILLSVLSSMTALESGTYIYTNTATNKAISGAVSGGKLTSTLADTKDVNQHYYIEFNAAADTATILHVQSGTYVGYSGTKLVAAESKWAVFHEGDKTGFYMTYGSKTYILWPDYMDGYYEEYGYLIEASDVTKTPTAIKKAVTGGQGIEVPTSDSSLEGRGQKLLRDGQLHIEKNGKVYNAQGTAVR